MNQLLIALFVILLIVLIWMYYTGYDAKDDLLPDITRMVQSAIYYVKAATTSKESADAAKAAANTAVIAANAANAATSSSEAEVATRAATVAAMAASQAASDAVTTAATPDDTVAMQEASQAASAAIAEVDKAKSLTYAGVSDVTDPDVAANLFDSVGFTPNKEEVMKKVNNPYLSYVLVMYDTNAVKLITRPWPLSTPPKLLSSTQGIVIQQSQDLKYTKQTKYATVYKVVSV